MNFISLIIISLFTVNLFAKESTNASVSYLLKIDKIYAECVDKTGGITSEMLDCSATATDKLDKYLWPSKNRKLKQLAERKKFITRIDLFCEGTSASYEGTSWSVAYSDCLYQQFVKKIQKKSH